MMGEFRVHHVRFFEWTPKSVQCMSYNPSLKKLALSRGDGSLELWNVAEGWYQEEVIPGMKDQSIEDLVWQDQRLFSAGLDGNICEHDLTKLQIKVSCPSNAGPVWCLTSNTAKTRLAAGTEDGCVVLLDTDNNYLDYITRFDSQDSRLLCISWHPTEDLIVTGGIDNIRIWSVSSGRAMQRLTIARSETKKETVIWCVAFLSDMTIVSGDSRGKTCFWNGKQGTLIKAIQSHKGDVYCLSVDKTETSIVSSGVDSSVVKFSYIAPRENSDWKDWVATFVHNQHTHDVRAIQMIDKTVVTGGVDTNLIQFDLHAPGISGHRRDTAKNRWKRIPPLIQKPIVSVAKDVNVILLPYTHHLDIWRLGFTDKTGVDGDILSLRSNPIKLVSMATKGGSPIFCSDISQDASLLAYSDCECLRVYRIFLDELTSIQPSVSMKKIGASADSPPDGAHCLCFTSDNKRLISVTNSSRLQISSIKHDKISTYHTFDQMSDCCHLLSVSPDDKLAAVADHNCNVFIYHIKNKQHVCNVPRQSVQVTALSFNPDSDLLAMVYSNQKIFEYDVKAKEYSDWSKKNSHHFMNCWLRKKSKVYKLSYNPSNRNQMILNDEQMFCILDKTQPFPSIGTSWTQLCTPKSNDSHAFHICTKYKYLLHLEILPENWLVAVERPSLEMFSSLPEAMKRKKFGT
ncbi:U3 small nucleolar RNA-associated protein 4 [Mactra antiquata]